jgi:large conductance mechanosensitive channel
MNEKIKSNKELLRKHSARAEEKAKKAIDDYKKFAIKGNIVDLAIGVVIGSAFTNIINTLVSSFITPLISMVTNKVDIGSLFISLSGGKYSTLEQAKAAGAIVVNYGALFNAILNFFIISIILFIVFKYVSKLRDSSEKGSAEEAKQTTKECPYCKSTININATKCAFCTSEMVLEDIPEIKNTKVKK